MQGFHFDTLDSTNNKAKALIADGQITGAAYVVAREQTAGRGTRGRNWISPLDAGIYLTVVDRPQTKVGFDLTLFTRAAGIACAEVLQSQTGADVRLKPINDLYVQGRKLGGILTEAIIEQQQLKFLITGVGINVRKVDRLLRDAQVEAITIEEIVSRPAFSQLEVGHLVTELVRPILRWNAVVAREELCTLEANWEKYALPVEVHELDWDA